MSVTDPQLAILWRTLLRAERARCADMCEKIAREHVNNPGINPGAVMCAVAIMKLEDES